MRFSHELSYDASPDEVRAMIADPAFRERVCEAMHASSYDVSVTSSSTGSGESVTVVVDQTQPARGIPSYATRLLGDEIRIIQRETWTDASRGSLTLEIPGKPGTFDGTVVLTGDSSTVETVDGEVKVRVPLVGGKLESLVGDLFRAALGAEERVGRAWLAGER
jgi:hypothetical protein